MTWSFWTAPGGRLSVRPLSALPEPETPFWRDRTPPAGLGKTGERNPEDRLGWVDLPLTAASELAAYRELREELLREGFERLVMVAMGGSGLCPQALVSGLPRGRGLDAVFLDSLAPEAVREAIHPGRLARTVFLVASKSGATVEIRILESVIFKALQDAGLSPGRRLVALSDPGSLLHRWADTAGYRRRFFGKVNVGGRFSALSPFGLLPAVLAGCELEEELREVRRVRETLDTEAVDPAPRLGALLARLRAEGRSCAHLSASAEREAMLPWLEQLFSESTGKQGTGILPVVLPAPPRPETNGSATLAVHLGDADDGDRERLEALAGDGVPVIHCPTERSGLLPDIFRWQVAIGVAAYGMGVDPYDQPDVESSKAAAHRLAANPGASPRPPAVSDADIEAFMARAAEGDLAINAFGHRSRTALATVEALGRSIAARFRVAPAVGFGSALLHSLGQLEKGGPEELAILMLTWRPAEDVVIPPGAGLPPSAAGIGTGAFARLQAAADYEELNRRGRRVLWLDSDSGGEAGLRELAARLIPGCN